MTSGRLGIASRQAGLTTFLLLAHLLAGSAAAAACEQADCGEGWCRGLHDGHCVRLFSEDPATWCDACARCAAEGSSLVSIHSAEYRDLLRNLISEEQGLSWIGLYQREGAEEPHGGWWWLDGNEFGESESITWGFGEPNDVSGACGGAVGEDCAELQLDSNDWLLHDKSCQGVRSFFCEKTLGAEVPLDPSFCAQLRPCTSTTTTTCPSDDCGEGWCRGVQYGHCVRIFLREEATWCDACWRCAAERGSLISINSALYGNYFRGLAEESRLPCDSWIGLSQHAAAGSVHEAQNGWWWVDGSLFENKAGIPWSSGRPAGGPGETCAELQMRDYGLRLNVNHCQSPQGAFICEKFTFMALRSHAFSNFSCGQTEMCRVAVASGAPSSPQSGGAVLLAALLAIRHMSQ